MSLIEYLTILAAFACAYWCVFRGDKLTRTERIVVRPILSVGLVLHLSRLIKDLYA